GRPTGTILPTAARVQRFVSGRAGDSARSFGRSDLLPGNRAEEDGSATRLVEVDGALPGPVQSPGDLGRVERVLEGRGIGDAVEELAGDEEVMPVPLLDVEPALDHHEQVRAHAARVVVHARALEVPAQVPPGLPALPRIDPAP